MAIVLMAGFNLPVAKAFDPAVLKLGNTRAGRGDLHPVPVPAAGRRRAAAGGMIAAIALTLRRARTAATRTRRAGARQGI
jgi:hypothetical protein